MKKIIPLVFLLTIFILLEPKKESYIVEIPKQEENTIIDYDYIKPNNMPFIKNKDFKGSLSILNTSFHEPIYQTVNNTYYLDHDANFKEDIKGVTFLDYRVKENSPIKIIYSHNTRKLTLPFSFLENYYNNINFEKDYPIFKLSLKEDTYYKVVSVFVETNPGNVINIDNPTNYHYDELLKRSVHDYKETLSNKDEILILQTCSKSQDFENYDNKYLFVALKRLNNITF